MKEKLLLHCCCAPCASAIIEHLKDHFDITLYFYNPNITDENELHNRIMELNKLRQISDIKIIVANDLPIVFTDWAANLKHEPEGGKRCVRCYKQRLMQTAIYAKKNGFNYFSTTLTISPYKDSAVVNSAGKICGWDQGVMYMPFDFGFLYIRSLELCEELGLYQQNYCGCEYSKN